MIWKNLIRPALFCLSPERVHHLSMGAFSATAKVPLSAGCFRRCYQVQDPRLHVELFGLDFANPVGLGAGFDKDAHWFNQLALLGFGSIEVGTLTRHAQPGNDRPRLFRLPQDHAIINRMGFNNRGAEAASQRLSTTKIKPLLGINIGKSKITPLEEATEDYLFSFEKLFSYAAYFTVNVSSPNTPGLRELQNREPLLELLKGLQNLNQSLATEHGVTAKPILLKIAPDLNGSQVDDIVSIIKSGVVAGVIATNTTISRDDLRTPSSRVEEIGAGGLSGSPLTIRSREFVRALYQKTEGAVPIIGVGGIMKGHDAWEMLRAGASLVQIYTGFIYGGPGTVGEINRHLLRKLDETGMSSISEVTGSAV